MSGCSAGVKRAYAEHNGVTPPMRKMHMLSIPLLPPMNFPIAPKFLFNLDPSGEGSLTIKVKDPPSQR